MKLIVFILTVFFFLHTTSLAQSVDGKLDAFIRNEMKLKSIPGLAFAVVKDNKVVHMKSYGYANLDHLVPVTNQTIFPIASVDKQLIATCIMSLHENVKLHLEDPVSKYLDSIPSSWKDMQIHHLMSHTSGLPDEPLEYRNGKGYDRYTSEDIYRYLIKQELAHTTGEKFHYSDAGFFLLQQIFEKASGLYYPDFVRDSIFKPLGMKHTLILDPMEIVKGRSVSYYRNSEGKLLINTFRQISVGPHYGDIGTSIEDFVKYNRAIDENKFLKKQSYQLMWTPAILNDRRKVSQLVDEADLFNAAASYGLGWELDSFEGRKVVYHAGFTGTSITKFPELGLTVILLTNLTYRPLFSPNALAKQIATFYLPALKNRELPATQDNPDSPEKIMSLLRQTRPDNTLFEPSFYQIMLPALVNYQRIIARYGNAKEIRNLYIIKENGKTVQTIEAVYPVGSLLYHVTKNAKGQIDFISIERK